MFSLNTERYVFILKKSGLSKKDFVTSLGLSPSLSYQIASSRAKFPCDLLETLSTKYNVNLQWFITGKGNFSLSNTETKFFQILRSIVQPYNPHGLKAVYVKGDSMIDEHINDGDIVIFHPKRTEGTAFMLCR